MSVFPSDTSRKAWTESWCDRCHQPQQAELRLLGRGDGCPLLKYADSTGLIPLLWKPRRGGGMGDTYTCDAYLDKPPIAKRRVSTEQTLPMFDIEP